MSDPSPKDPLRAAVSDYLQRQQADAAEPLADFVSASGFAREVVDELMRELQGGAAEDDNEPRDFGRFEILHLLGRGGMGTVHVAHDKQLDRQVALKRIRPDLLSSPEARRRFESEIRGAAGLDHPNICKVFDAGEHEGRPYLVMQYVAGTTLAAKVKAARQAAGEKSSSAALATADCLVWIEKIARGLHHAHEHGLIHRDVKPSNILIRDDGEPFLLDFGVARPLADRGAGHERLTTVGAAPGTMRYMSPEQLQPRGRALDGRTDVFSLGLVLAELLMLRHPFVSDSDVEVAHAILKEEPRFDGRRGLGASLATVLRVALAKDPAHRYASAAAFADDLGRVRRYEPIVAGEHHRTVSARLWIRRRPWLAVGLVALAVLSVAVALVVRTAGNETREALQKASTVSAALAASRPYSHPEEALAAAVEAAHMQRDPAIDTLLWRGLDSCGRAYGINRKIGEHGMLMTSPALDASGEHMALLKTTGELVVVRTEDGALLFTGPAHERGEIVPGLQALAFRPGGDVLFSGGNDGLIKTWSTVDWREQHREPLVLEPGKKRVVTALAVSPDGRWLAAGADQGEIFLRDLLQPPDQIPLRLSLSSTEVAAGLRFSPASDELVVLWRTLEQRQGEFLGLTVLDCSTGKEKWSRRFDGRAVLCCEWHPQGRWIAIGTLAGDAVVLDGEQGGRVVFERRFRDPDRYVRWCGFDPSGQHLMIGAVPGIVIMNWTEGTASECATVVHAHERPLAALAFDPAGGLAAGLFRDGSMSLIELPGWRILRSFSSPPFATSLLSLQWAGGPRRIVAGRNYDIDVWQAPPGTTLPTLSLHRQAIHSMDLHPNGLVVLTASADGTVAETVLQTGKVHRITIGASVAAARLSPDGARFWVRDAAGRVRVFASGADRALLDVPGGLALWVDDDRLLVAEGSAAALIQVATGERTELRPLRGPIMAAAVDLARSVVFTGGADREVWMHDLSDPRIRRAMQTATVNDIEHGSLMGCVGALAALPGSKRLLASTINRTLSVLLYDDSGVSPSRVDLNTDAFGGRIAIDPDGRLAMLSDFSFGRTSWLDLGSTGSPGLVTNHVHSQLVTAIQFSRTGKLCLTASLDGTVRIWDCATRAVRSVLRREGTTCHDACFTADEQHFLTADGAGQVKVWPVDPLTCAEQYLAEIKMRSR